MSSTNDVAVTFARIFWEVLEAVVDRTADPTSQLEQRIEAAHIAKELTIFSLRREYE